MWLTVGGAALAVAVVIGCAPSQARPHTPAAVQDEGSSDVVVARGLYGSMVSIAVGQTLAVPRPTDAEEWQVDYSGDILRLIAPANVRRPGPGGWRFRAVAAGETDLALTVVVPPDRSRGQAPPQRFVVTIRVTAT